MNEQKIYRILLVAAFFAVGVVCPLMAQIDTQFWFAAPSITSDHTPGEISLKIVTYDDDATISISQPAAGRSLLVSRVVPKHSTFSFSLKNLTNYKTTVETVADGAVHNTGILVQSTAKVTAYYATTNPNSEVYTLKGVHGLGTAFVVPMQYRHACGHDAYSSVEVVASQDNTTVTIQTYAATNVSAGPDTITVMLNRGETYAIRSLAANTPATQLLGGTIVSSDKPIAVNTTDDSAIAGADLDLIGEQLVPTTLAGSHYIVPVNNSANHEYAYLYAIEDTAEVYCIDGSGQETLAATIWPGQPAECKLTRLDAPLFYTKDNTPFVCFHLTANENGSELSGTILPSLNCSGSQEVSYMPALSETEVRVSILTRTENVGYFTVNDSPYDLPASSFFPVAGDSTWSYCSCQVLALAGDATAFDIKNTNGVFHLGILDNGGGACSYGFFSNFGEISLYASPSQSYYMQGDTIHFHLTGANSFSHITWEGPQGVFAQDEADPYIANASVLQSGRYVVSAEHIEGCEVAPDTFYVNIFQATPFRSDTVCIGDSIRLRASMDKPLTWYCNDSLMQGQSSRYCMHHVLTDATYRIVGHETGVEMIDWTDTLAQTLPQADSAVIAEYHFSNLILGATYTWSATFLAPQNNTVAPKVRMDIEDAHGGIIAVSNGVVPTRGSVSWTATSPTIRLRLLVISPRPERSLAITTMSLRPWLPFEEIREVIAKDCSEPEPECPEPQYEETMVSVCDTILPYVWHAQYCLEAGVYYDTLHTTLSNGVVCDSVYYSLTLEVEHCECEYQFIAQRWNDVLFVLNKEYNGGYAIQTIRWYHNGSLMEDVTSSYLYVPEGLVAGDVYEVEVTTDEGQTIRSCPYTVVGMEKEQAAGAVGKVMRGGRILILRDGRTYTPDGVRVE